MCKLLLNYNGWYPKYISIDHYQYYFGKLVDRYPIHKIAHMPPLTKVNKKVLQDH
jgi:hypothetical protein